ncbi:MAG TPA: hypothetical protein VGF30_16815, partial [Bacteroidia bacterium]
MKNLISVLFITAGISLSAQTFTTQNFSGDGYPVSAGFPGKTDKSITPSATDTMMQVTAASGGLTYAFVASRVKSEQIAQKSIPGIISRLEAKATKVDAKQVSTIGGQASTAIKYINNKGSFITIHVTTAGRFIYQAFIIKKSAYPTDAEANAFFNTVAFQNGIVNNTTTTTTPKTAVATATVAPTNSNPSVVPATTPAATSAAWAVNDRVEVTDTKTGKVYGACIAKINTNGTYRVNYDGYGENYDEDVDPANLKSHTTATTPTNVPYVKVKKGTTVSVKGDLKNGAIVEDLEWAELSSMACWPGIRNVEFEGNQVGYWMDIPKKSIVKITVTPKSTKHRINIYGYSGFDLKKTPPEVSRCTTCEASHPTWIGEPNLNEP